MLNVLRLVSRASTRVQEANSVQARFLAGWGGLLFSIIFFSGLGPALSQSGSMAGFPLFCKVFGIGLVVAGASALIAWLLGLLFGIPRSSARPNGSPTPNTAGGQMTSRVNTNLEDVSDWLTKTLVGVGLTQLTSLPHNLWHYATVLNDVSLKGDGGGPVFILGVAVAGGAGGFWVGYVTTRTILRDLLDQFDFGDILLAGDPKNLQLGDNHRLLAPTDPDVAAADVKLRSIPFNQLTSPKEMAAWGAAQARAANYSAALDALHKAATASPSDANIQTLLETVTKANKGS
jgi:hypothetical protein